jgi:hypothetical protein
MKRLILVTSLCLGSAAFSAPLSPLEQGALTLLKKMPSSDYGTRKLCVFLGKMVVGTYSPGHWSLGLMISRGTTDNFPTSFSKFNGTPANAIQLDSPSGPEDWGRFKKIDHDSTGADFYIANGSVDGRPADLCVFESKAVLE